MDSWQAVQNYVIFLPVAGAVAWYYLSTNRPRVARGRDHGLASAAAKKRRGARQQPDGRASVNDAKPVSSVTAHHIKPPNPRKRKVQIKSPTRPEPVVTTTVHESGPAEELDMTTQQFAQQMMQARQGYKPASPKSKEQQPMTVKQSAAHATPGVSSGTSEAGVDADDDLSPAQSPTMRGGYVSDMLEAKVAGPTTLRLTAPLKPLKEKVKQQPKEEVVETKKQRQQRLKNQERKLRREQEERERRVLEEKQRCTAREARGEAAKNGIPIAASSISNPWTAASTRAQNDSALPAGNHVVPLLDTFDAESSSSGGPESSTTGATSATEAGLAQQEHDLGSEEEQMAKAMKQSEDEFGWTTVEVPKKQQKKKAMLNGDNVINGSMESKSALNDRPAKTPASPAVGNGKPKGYRALEDQYVPRTDADPNDASNWDA